MADKYWVGDVSSDWEVTNNWSTSSGGAGNTIKPGVGDAAIFDGAGTGDTACTLTAAGSVASLSVTSGYSAKLDLATYNLTSAGDMTFDGTGEFDCGTGTITCSGNFDGKDQGTWTRGTSTLVMDGTAKTIIGDISKDLYNLTISGTITLSATTVSLLDVQGDLDIQVGATLTLNEQLRMVSTLERTFTLSGDILGSDILQLIRVVLTHDGGSISSGTAVWLKSASSLLMTGGSQTFGGTWTCTPAAATPTLLFGAGSFTFSGDVTFDAATAAGTYTINLGTNNPDINFEGDVTLSESLGTLAWTKGTGDITFGGATDYTDSTAVIQVLGDVVVDGTSLTLASEMECDDFTGTSGTLTLAGNTLDSGGNVSLASGFLFGDPAGGTIDMTGNFTADGNDLTAGSATWYLTVGGASAVASGSGDVDYCDADGGTEITASAGPWTDSGNNTNWDFGGAPPAVVPTPYYYQSLLAG